MGGIPFAPQLPSPTLSLLAPGHSQPGRSQAEPRAGRQPSRWNPYLPPALRAHPAARGAWLAPSRQPGLALAAAAVAGTMGVPASCPWPRAAPSPLAGQPAVPPPAAAPPAALPAAAWPPAAAGARGAPASALEWPARVAGGASAPWGSRHHGGEQWGGMTGGTRKSRGRRVQARGARAAAPSWRRLVAHGHGARVGWAPAGAAWPSGAGARRWRAGRCWCGARTPHGAGARGAGGSRRAATGPRRGARRSRGRCA